MDRRAIVRRRLYGQRLAGERAASPAEAVRWLGAVQAQEHAEAKWSIGQRVRECADAAFARGEILRTHLLRPTWHFVCPDDIRWMLALTAPRVHAANRYMYRRLELTDEVLAQSAGVLTRELSGREPRVRTELADALARAGIEANGLRLGYILMHAELEALICSGPRRGRQHTYALLDDLAPQGRAVTRDEALAELVLRFFRSRGPATVRDLTTWSSLTVSDAKAGLEMVEDHLDHELDEDGTPWYAAERRLGGTPRTADALLLPMYDEMVMGYRDLKVVVANAPPREGLLRRPVAIDGLTVGSWKRTLAKREAVVEVTLLAHLDPSATETLKGALERFGRFLDLPGRLEAAIAE